MRSFRSYAPGQNSPVKSFLRTHQTAGCALKKKPDSPSAAADSLRLRVEKQSFSLDLHLVCVFLHTRERAAEGILSHVCAAHFAGIVRLFVCAADSRLFLFGRCCTRCVLCFLVARVHVVDADVHISHRKMTNNATTWFFSA
jgi:hypothetical protein